MLENYRKILKLYLLNIFGSDLKHYLIVSLLINVYFSVRRQAADEESSRPKVHNFIACLSGLRSIIIFVLILKIMYVVHTTMINNCTITTVFMYLILILSVIIRGRYWKINGVVSKTDT